ncbi:hypothetical protein Bca4012_044106 [Brassica carinata]
MMKNLFVSFLHSRRLAIYSIKTSIVANFSLHLADFKDDDRSTTAKLRLLEFWKSTLLSELRGRETTGGHGSAGNTFQAIVLANWSTHEAKANIQSPAGSRTSAPPEKTMHKHGAGPQTFVNIEYNMIIDDGFEEPPPCEEDSYT